jgi:hypothetical protein
VLLSLLELTELPLETLLLAEFITLELLPLTQLLIVLMLLPVEEVLVDLIVMLTALWEEPVAISPTVILLRDLLTCSTLVKKDASTFAPLFSHKEQSVTINLETPLLADFTTLKLLLDLEI